MAGLFFALHHTGMYGVLKMHSVLLHSVCGSILLIVLIDTLHV